MLQIADLLVKTAKNGPQKIVFDDSAQAIQEFRLWFATKILEMSGTKCVLQGKGHNYNNTIMHNWLFLYVFRFDEKRLPLLL